MNKSLDNLEKSQLLTLKGEAVSGHVQASRQTGLLVRLAPGSIIDQKYRVIELLGEGGMGAVYKAHHLLLNKDVALKTFRSASLDPTDLNRFQREARAIGRLAHPNIVQIFDFGVGEDNLPYYTMECLEGEPLSERLSKGGPLGLEEAVELFVQVCDGLSQAHQKGIIHRDLKPGNIFLERSSTIRAHKPLPKVVDFGLAGWASQSLESQKLTGTGTIFGSPLYMSPEQSLGQDLNASSDIYSLGCTLFEALTGSPPYRGDNAFATMYKHQTAPIPELRKPDGGQYPDRLKGLLKRMLAKEPDKRIDKIEAVAAELNALLKRGTIKSAQPDTPVEPAAEDLEQDGESAPGPGKPWLLPAIAVALVLLLIGGLRFFGEIGRASAPKPPAKIITVTSVPPLPPAPPPVPPAKPNKPPQAIKKYLVGPPGDSSRPRTFNFPKDYSLGQLEISPDFAHAGAFTRFFRPAKGPVNVPAHAWLTLNPHQEVYDHPWLLDGFGAEDLDTLRLSNEWKDPRTGEKIPVEWGNKHLAHVGQLTHLRVLIIDGAEVDNLSVDSLSKLIGLKVLSVPDTTLTGRDLAKLPYLHDLHSIVANKIGDCPALLTKLSGSRSITYLKIERCHLHDSDLSMLATMPNLREVFLTGNRDITNRGLGALDRLQHVRELHINQTQANAGGLATLKGLKSLKVLFYSEGSWSTDKLNELKASLPDCDMIAVPDTK